MLSGVRFRCLRCGYSGPSNGPRCPHCGFPLIVEPRGALRIDRDKPSILRYASALNYGPRVVSLGEGFTRIRRVSGVLIKDESRNPTGSFMDRGSSVLISNIDSEVRALFEEDFTLSIATYANAVGISVKVYVDPDRVGAYPELLRLSVMSNVSIEFSGKREVNVYYGDPLFLDGVKTIAYELYEQVGEVEGVVLPMERGYLALAIYEGFRELREWGFISELPRLILVKHRTGKVGDIGSWLIETANARVVDVGDEETIRSMIELARSGMYVKPVSAMAYAVASTLGRDYVAVITGTGVKEYRVGRELGGLTKLQEAVIGVLEGSRPLTAYEVWERLGGAATIQGVYKALNSLVRRGLVAFNYEVRGNKKVRVYSLLSNYK